MKKVKNLILLIVFTFAIKTSVATNGDTLIVNPNPVDSIAVIQFTIANNDTIWLDIYNVIGNSIKTFYNATVLPSGTYTLSFNGDTLPDGIYFVVLKINSTKTLTKKLVKQTNAVGLKENDVLQNIKLYPNPTNSLLNIVDENNQLQNTTIQIKNNFGQLVYSSPFTSQINLHILSAGMYFLTIEDKSNKKTIKIIKQ